MMHQTLSRAFHFIVFCSLFLEARPQEMLGVMNSNFSGVNGAVINPANTLNSGQMININLLAGDFFISSNYIYIHKKDYGLLKIFRVNIMDPQYLYTYDYPQFNYTDSLYYFDYFKNSKPKNVYLNNLTATPTQARTIPIIQNRIVTLYAGQPIASK